MVKKLSIAVILGLVLVVGGIKVFDIVQANKEAKLDREWAEQKAKDEAEKIEEIKREATKANFVELNSGATELLAKKVFVEGKVSFIDTTTVPKTFTLTSTEDNGYGMYTITFYDEAVGDLITDGDTVKVFGLAMGSSDLGMPKITCEAIEKL